MITPLPNPPVPALPVPALRAENVEIRPPADPIDWLEATALLHDYVEWLRAAVGVEPLDAQPALRRELADLAGHYDGRRAVLFLATIDRLAVGTIAVRYPVDGPTASAAARAGTAAELKRMYLRPMARGLGLADRLVDRAVASAGSRGCTTIWLETLPGVMDPALAVYRRNGFVETADGSRSIGVDGIVTLERTVTPVDRTAG